MELDTLIIITTQNVDNSKVNIQMGVLKIEF